MKYPKGYCDIKLVTLLMEELKPEIVWLHFAGEPTLHPQLPKLAELCDGKAAIVTNAYALTPSLSRNLLEAGVKWIINSVVGATSEVYKHVNGLDLDKTYYNISRLYALREKYGYSTRITNRIIVCRENIHQIDYMKLMWSKNCDDLHIVKEFKVPMTTRNLIGNFRVNCILSRKLSTVGCVKWDGAVVPCCNDLDGWNVFGNVYKQSFMEIYESERFEGFRQTLRSSNKPLVCECCDIAPSKRFNQAWRVLT